MSKMSHQRRALLESWGVDIAHPRNWYGQNVRDAAWKWTISDLEQRGVLERITPNPYWDHAVDLCESCGITHRGRVPDRAHKAAFLMLEAEYPPARIGEILRLGGTGPGIERALAQAELDKAARAQERRERAAAFRALSAMPDIPARQH